MIIKCLECKSKISDKASTCPKCGCPVDHTLTAPQVKSKNGVSIGIFISVLLTALLLAIVIIYFYSNTKVIAETETENKYSLFKYSSVNSADTYGLANENNILGENINDVLAGYIENEDYYITENEYYRSYTFYQEIPYVAGHTANLVIYTPLEDEYINMVEYKFRVASDERDYSDAIALAQIKKDNTNYYDVDPKYDYLNNYEIVDVTREDFYTILRNDTKSIFHICWNGENGSAILTINNIYEERSNDWSVSFTK